MKNELNISLQDFVTSVGDLLETLLSLKELHSPIAGKKNNLVTSEQLMNCIKMFPKENFERLFSRLFDETSYLATEMKLKAKVRRKFDENNC